MAKKNILEDLRQQLEELIKDRQAEVEDENSPETLATYDAYIARIEKQIAEIESVKNQIQSDKEKVGKPKTEKTKTKQKPKKKEPVKDTSESKEVTPSGLKVGEEMLCYDGQTRVKRTAADTYILLYLNNPQDDVVITRSGINWIADCCKNNGIIYADIDNAVLNIIVAKECAAIMEKKVDVARKRAKTAKKNAKKSPTTKVKETLEKTAESIEKKAAPPEGKPNAKTISASATSDFVTEITNIVKAIEEGIKEKAERKSFIKKLIEKLQTELESI
jgi:hypothetical protein